MRLIKIVLIILCLFTLAVTSGYSQQSALLFFDTEDDAIVCDCHEIVSIRSYVCLMASLAFNREDQYAMLLLIDSVYQIDTIRVNGLKPSANHIVRLYYDINEDVLYMLGADELNDSILKILRWNTASQANFQVVNSIYLPGAVQQLSPVRLIGDELYLTGTYKYGSVSNDVFLMKLDSMNSIKPEFHSFQLTNDPGTYSYDIVAYSNGLMLSFKNYPTTPPPYSLSQFVLLDSGYTNPRGVIVPENIFGYMNFVRLYGKLYFSGRKITWISPGNMDDDIVIGILDTIIDTVVSWRYKTIGRSDVRDMEGLKTLASNSNFVFIGGTTDFSQYHLFTHDDADFIVGKFDTALNEQWVKIVGLPDRNDMLWGLLATSDGGVFLAGTTYDYVNNPKQERDLLFYKLDSNGSVVGTNRPEYRELPSIRIYPNPASTQLNLALPSDFTGQLMLMDMMGRSMGNWPVLGNAQISVSHLPQGLYLYSISSSGQQVHSGKVLIVRN